MKNFKRVLWGLTLVGTVGGGGGWWWYSHTPTYHWQRANAALTRQDWAVAEIHLRNVVASAPNDVPARVALANVSVELANAEAERPQGVDPPAAMEQLIEVARLQPENMVIRERLLRDYLRTKRADAAAATARELAALGSTNGDALYLAANAAIVEKRWTDADALIERFGEKVTRLAPLYLSLKVRWLEGQEDDGELDKWLGPILRQLSQLSELGRQALSANERRALGAVVVAGLRCAPRESAERRWLTAMTILERAALADKTPESRSEFVEHAARLGSVMESVHSQPVAATKSNNPVELRRMALQKFVRLAEPTLQAGRATPLAYEQLARAASLMGDDVRALALLHQGIEQHRQLPAERQSELLALQWQAAVRLVMQRRFAEAAKPTESLLAQAETRPLGQLLAGAVALEEGRLEAAEQHLAEIVPPSGEPRSVVVQALRLRIQLSARRWAAALELLKELDRDWDTRSPAQTKWLAETLGSRESLLWRQTFCLLALNQAEPARELLSSLETGPLRTKAQWLRVVDLVRSQQRTEAWDTLRAARREAPDDFDLLMAEFNLLVQDGAMDGATRLLTGQVRRQPRDPAVRLALAQWLSHRGDATAALRELSEMRRLFPNAEAPCVLAANLLQSADRAEEFQALLKSMTNTPALAKLVPLLQAQANLRRAGLAEAANALQQADAELERQPAFKVTAAAIAFQQHDAAKAFDLLADSLAFANARPLVQTEFLKAFAAALQSADPKSVNARVEQLLTKYPREPVVLLAAAEVAFRRGDIATALTRVEQLDQVDSLPGRTALLRAKLCMAQGRVEDALSQLDAAIAAAPQSVAARLLAAQWNDQRHEPELVLEHLAALPSAIAERIDVVLQRAKSLMQLKRSAEVPPLLEGLIRLQPQQPQPYLSLAAFHESAGDLTAALETIKRGRRQLPQQPQLQAALLTLQVRTGQSSAAAESARQFAGQTPSEAECLRWARVFLVANQFEPATTWLQRARTVANARPSDELLFLEALLPQQAGTLRENSELLAEAREKYDVLLKRSPGHVAALNNLAWLLVQRLNQPAEAFAVAEQLRAEVPRERLGADLFDTLVEVYRRTGHEREALDLLTDGVARFPNSAILRFQHAALLLTTAGDDASSRDLARQELSRAKRWGIPAHRVGELEALLAQVNDQ
jgi:tetratricopeptide (TPR) repeat protein